MVNLQFAKCYLQDIHPRLAQRPLACTPGGAAAAEVEVAHPFIIHHVLHVIQKPPGHWMLHNASLRRRTFETQPPFTEIRVLSGAVMTVIE